MPGLRLDSLMLELQSRGLSSLEAEELSCEFVQRHPIAHRLGMKRLARNIEKRGLASESAHLTAGMLLGIELGDRGATFDQVLTELRRLGLERSEALEAALSSARIYRDIRSQSDLPVEATGTVLRATAWLGLALLALSVAVQLAP